MSPLVKGVRPRRLGHLGIVARDLARLVEFYCTVLDLRVTDRMLYEGDPVMREAVFLRCNTDHHVLSIFGLHDAAQPVGDPRAPRPGLHHIAFEMGSFEELRTAARYVREHGLDVRAMRRGGPGDQVRMYFWDPEDNLVELYWGLDQIGWDGVARPYPPFEAVDIETFDLESWLDWKGSELTSPAGTRSAPARPRGRAPE